MFVKLALPVEVVARIDVLAPLAARARLLELGLAMVEDRPEELTRPPMATITEKTP